MCHCALKSDEHEEELIFTASSLMNMLLAASGSGRSKGHLWRRDPKLTTLEINMSSMCHCALSIKKRDEAKSRICFTASSPMNMLRAASGSGRRKGHL